MKAFEIFVTLALADKFTGPMASIGRQMGLLSKQSEALEKQLTKFKNLMFVGSAITGFGVAAGAGLLHATDAAGRLQMSIMGVKQALGLTGAEFQKAMNLSQTVGLPTIFSAEDVGGIMKAMATAGLSKKQVLDTGILQRYVNFGDVQAQIKHENAPDVVSNAINMAHMYQLYSTQQLSPFLNQLNAALLHTHDSAGEFATQFRYIANQARTMGMGASDTLAATAWLGRMGFGSGRGGTNFATFLQRGVYGLGKKHDAAMDRAGLVVNGHSVFENAQGKFVGVPEAVKIMQSLSTRFHGNANILSPLLHDIFGVQGGRVAMMMTSSGAAEQYTNVQKQIGSTASVNDTQETLNKTWQGQMKQFETTLADIEQNFGRALMPSLLKFLSTLNDISGAVLKFTQAHPEVMRMVAAFAEIATAAALIIGPFMVVVGALGYLAQSGIIMSGIGMIGSALSTALPILAAVGIGVALLHTAWVHNWGDIQGKTTKFIAWFKAHAPAMGHAIIAVIKKIPGYWNTAMDYLEKGWKVVNDFWRGATDGVMGLWEKINLKWAEITGQMTIAWHGFEIAITGGLKNIQTGFFALSNTPWMQWLAGGNVQQNVLVPAVTNRIPGHAMGTNFHHGGLAWVGEHGKELVNLPRGSQVIPNNRLGGGHSFVLNLYQQPHQDMEEFARVIYREIGRLMRDESYASPDAVVNSW